MALHRVPVEADDTGQEAIGPEPHTDTSPAEMQAFYEDMERREILERKLSDRKSISGTSVWSHRTLKPTNSNAQPVPMPDLARKSSNNSNSHQINDQRDPSEHENFSDNASMPNPAHQLHASRSIIGDSRNNGSIESDPWDSVPMPTFKVYYPLHNPMGPRWYRNYHLIPPSQMKPSMRPPTFFSPSFPPMASSSPTEHVDSPGASSSHLPHNTPSSSQTKVATRTRKTSQTAPDTVDLLDVTDPWGTNWHHQSPYDIGKTTTVAADPYEMPSRPRRASMSTAQGHRSVMPSPLSQSTSAVHLHQPLQIQIPRKLSKRRPSAGAIFRSGSDRKANSVPTTPIESASVIPGPPPNGTHLPKRMSVAPPVDLTAYKREKRGSFMGRLVKKFSIMKKPPDNSGSMHNVWQPAGSGGAYSPNGNMYGNDVVFRREQSPEKQESIRRVPPPTFDPPEDSKPPPLPPPDENGDDHASLSSLDTPFSRGRLTIANPDSGDGDEEAAPAPESPNGSDSNPPEQPTDAPTEPHESSQASIRHSRFDKPLPPPRTGTPDNSHIALSDLGILQAIKTNPSTPETTTHELPPDQDSPPPPPPSDGKPHNSESDSPDGPFIAESQVQLPEVKADSLEEMKPEQVVSKPHAPVSLPAIQTSPTHRLSVDKRRARSPPIQSKSPSIFETPRRPLDPKQSVHQGSRHGTTSRDVTPPKRARRSQDQNGPSSPGTTQPNPITIRPFDRTKSRQANGVGSPPVSHVPFPAVHSAVPFPNADSRLSMASYVESVSVVVNPPTPYTNRLSLAISEPPTLPPKSVNGDKEDHNLTPVNPSPTRQTEVFKLVRSPSGNAYTSMDTIQAAGEHWEVVGSAQNESRAKLIKTKEAEPKVRESVRSQVYDDGDDENYDYERKLKEHELERQKEWEREKERQREREKQALEREREKELQREREREVDKERERERERIREWDREKEREKEKEKERERERERDKERERVRQKERERERERAKEKERAREKEREKEREREREKEREREGEKEKLREREREKEKEKDRERRQKEREESFYTARDYERQSKTYDMIPKELPPNPRDTDHRPRIIEPDSRSRERRSRNHYDYSSRDHPRRATDDSRRSKDDERRSHERETSTREVEHRESTHRLKERTKEYSTSYHRSKEDPKPTEPSSNHRSEGRRPSKQTPPLPEGTSKHRSSDKRTVRQPDDALSYNEHHSSRRVEESHDRRSERKTTAEQHASVTYHTLAPTTVYVQMPTAAPDHLRPDRHQFISIRPTSELPSPDEMNAVRAKESWEMERLWKARSMYGLEPNAPTTNFIPGPGSTSSFSDETPTPPVAVHGSSYTAYVVQPFQATPSHIYHSMPPAPPPVIYSSPASIPSIPDFLSSSDPAENYQQLSHPISSSISYRPLADPSRLSSHNPLPAPPRESKYEPAPLTAIKPSKKIAADYFRPITTTR